MRLDEGGDLTSLMAHALALNLMRGRMKKDVLLISLLVLVAMFNVGAHRSVGVAMRIQVNTVGLPEHGLTLINSSDPLFNKLAGDAIHEQLKPFSVLLKNIGDKRVIAYQLKWTLTRPDGRVLTNTQGFVNLNGLKRVTPEDLGSEVGPSDESVFDPGAVMLCSPAGNQKLGKDDNDSSTSIVISTSSKPEAGNEATQVRPEVSRASHMTELSEQLSQLSNITVSLDGALFDDGVYVGPDSTHFFSLLRSRWKARADLIREVGEQAHAKSRAEYLRALAEGPRLRLNHKSTPDDIYNYYKQRLAQRVVMMQAAGDFKELQKEMSVLTNPYVEPRKL